MRFTRVVFGLTSSPVLLNGTMKIHVSKHLPVPYYTDTVKKFILNLYGDNSTNSFDTIETAIEFYQNQNLVWEKQTLSYENGLQIVLSWKSLLIQMKIIDDLKWISAKKKHFWKTHTAVAALIESFGIKLRYRCRRCYIWFW